MRILFTGASSFTGYWFVRELAAAGHSVSATFRRSPDAYEGIRKQRVDGLADSCTFVYPCSFGDPCFMELLGNKEWDVLCHHAADVTNYKSPDFDVVAALANNTHGIRSVLMRLVERGCRRVVLTGSVFEPREGAGSEGLRGFSPYGLSKALTAEMFGYYAGELGLHLGKLVVPNPFGPFEEPRFTAYLMRTWFAGEAASVRTPAYLRDNIHVSLLAKAYRGFVETRPGTRGTSRFNPSGYVETQGAFARRFASEMGQRLKVECRLELAEQTTFEEPRMRINTDPVDGAALGWDERSAWDEIALYYEEVHGVRG